ncbi:MAG: hypothetical protein U0871_01425 [Gemmataceae bacterium]
MSDTAVTPRYLSATRVAVSLRLPEHVVRRAIKAGVLVPEQRVGGVMLFVADDLPAIRTALIQAGFIPPSDGPSTQVLVPPPAYRTA